MEISVRPARARTVPVLPHGPGWWYEPEFTGQRTLLHRDRDGVHLYGPTGRNVTAAWPDLARAAAALPVGALLDGVAVIWRDGCLDPGAVHARAGAGVLDAAELARSRPAAYAAFDLLGHPRHGDVRDRGYAARRALLLGLLEEIGPPLQAVPATDDHETALLWYDALREQGVDGVLAKAAADPYRVGEEAWQRVRHRETVELPVVGYTGAAARPKALVVRLPDGRHVPTEPLGDPQREQAVRFLMSAGPAGREDADDGRPYAATAEGLAVTARTGPSRHAAVHVVAVRIL
ncbi:hypothetical protein [Streptomyces sp. NRRL S-87]|uniref:ATP-dependent DNA ligase n=1 Tax=Streptomyces sp. NRRL S-87 TaxID=1463920 RepID=UPI00068993E9|nr:hypothetical protein [Streptomyces sp. NRRL S-87]